MCRDDLTCGESSKGATVRYRFATKAVHAGFKPEDFRGCPVVLPISPATTFKQPSPEHLQVRLVLFNFYCTVLVLCPLYAYHPKQFIIILNLFSLQQFIYSRITNPTRECVENNLAALEDAKFCIHSLISKRQTNIRTSYECTCKLHAQSSPIKSSRQLQVSCSPRATRRCTGSRAPRCKPATTSFAKRTFILVLCSYSFRFI